MKMQFKDIIIPELFKNSKPSENKLRKCREAYERGELDRALVVDGKNILRDGYVLYTVMKEHNYDGEVEVEHGSMFINQPTTYVFGKHMGDDRERVWYINMSYDKVKNTVGRLADVHTKHGIQTITITRVERLDRPPYPGIIRKVARI